MEIEKFMKKYDNSFKGCILEPAIIYLAAKRYESISDLAILSWNNNTKRFILNMVNDLTVALDINDVFDKAEQQLQKEFRYFDINPREDNTAWIYVNQLALKHTDISLLNIEFTLKDYKLAIVVDTEEYFYASHSTIKSYSMNYIKHLQNKITKERLKN